MKDILFETFKRPVCPEGALTQFADDMPIISLSTSQPLAQLQKSSNIFVLNVGT